MKICVSVYGKLSPEAIDKLIADYGVRPETAILMRQGAPKKKEPFYEENKLNPGS